MKIGYLTMLILQLNALVDADQHRGVALDDIRNAIQSGSVLSWLESRFGRDIDLSLYDEQLRQAISEALSKVFSGYAGDERRKWGVENNGICLLIAWINEIIQWKVGDVSIEA